MQELHYISIIVDSIMDFGQMGLNRKDVYEYMKEWIMSYKLENNIEEMTKENFMEISDKLKMIEIDVKNNTEFTIQIRKRRICKILRPPIEKRMPVAAPDCQQYKGIPREHDSL